MYRFAYRPERTGLALVLCLGLLPSLHAQDEDGLDFLFDDGGAQQQTSEPQATPAPDAGRTIALPEESSPPPQRREPQRGRVLEEIIVTAQKREQSLTDVPISVSALSGEKLRDAGIENLSDLSEYAPNFKLVEGGLVPLIYMRGVGSGIRFEPGF